MANEAPPLLFDDCHIAIIPSRELTIENAREVRTSLALVNPSNIQYSLDLYSKKMEQQYQNLAPMALSKSPKLHI
jgi:hypothetical protein